LFIPLPIQKKKNSQWLSGNNLTGKRKNYGHEGPTTLCSIHCHPLIYWCCDDESPACVSCRVTSHVCHNVVKIEDKHKKELIDLQSVSFETLQQVEEMKRNLHLAETQADEVKQNYTSAIKKVNVGLILDCEIPASSIDFVSHFFYLIADEKTFSIFSLHVASP